MTPDKQGHDIRHSELMRILRRGLLTVPIAMGLILAIPTQAGNIPFSSWCNSTWFTAAGVCSNPSNVLDQISGMEGVQLNFFGSSGASDLNVGFKNFNYYNPGNTFQGKSRGSSNTDFTDDSWGSTDTSNWGSPQGDLVPPQDPQNPDDPPGQNKGFTSDFTSITNLDTGIDDPSPVPEPRYSALAALIAALAFLGFRGLQRRRATHSLHS